MHKVVIPFFLLFTLVVWSNAFGQEVEKRPLPGVPVEKGGVVLPTKRLVIEPTFQYSHWSRQSLSISGFTIFEAILIGKVEVREIKGDVFIPSLTFRLGLKDPLFEKDMELNVKTPWLFRREQHVAPPEDTLWRGATVSDSGFGDVEGNIYYHLFREKGKIPDIILNLGAKAPTGRDPYGLRPPRTVGGIDNVPVEFPTGTGHWGASGGLLFVKSSDPQYFLQT